MLHRLDADERKAVTKNLPDGACQEEPCAADRRVIGTYETAPRIIDARVPSGVESRREIGKEEGDSMRLARRRGRFHYSRKLSCQFNES